MSPVHLSQAFRVGDKKNLPVARFSGVENSKRDLITLSPSGPHKYFSNIIHPASRRHGVLVWGTIVWEGVLEVGMHKMRKANRVNPLGQGLSSPTLYVVPHRYF